MLLRQYFSLQWFGEAEKYVKAVFTLASKISPSVIFIDEVWLYWDMDTKAHNLLCAFVLNWWRLIKSDLSGGTINR